MIVYCNVKDCKWHDDDGTCKGPTQPAGHVALYIKETLGGQAMCTDLEYKDDFEIELEGAG